MGLFRCECIISLKEANEVTRNLESISFPANSSEIFGFSKGLCAKIFFNTLKGTTCSDNIPT